MTAQGERVARAHGRGPRALRPVSIETGVMKFAEGSALIAVGDTRVLVTATVESRVPPFLLDSGKGWVTAEYAMLPRATQTRSMREVIRGRPSGRTAEIQRLIGRSLRAVVDLSRLPNRSVLIDCDVLQADGGTRTASITGAYVALVEALGHLLLTGDIDRWPVIEGLAAVSAGVVRGTPILDLDYTEDQGAQVDMNVVGTAGGALVEIQGTGEERSFSRQELAALLDLGFEGIAQLVQIQERALASILDEVASVERQGRRRRAQPKDEADVWGKPGARTSTRK